MFGDGTFNAHNENVCWIPFRECEWRRTGFDESLNYKSSIIESVCSFSKACIAFQMCGLPDEYVVI